MIRSQRVPIVEHNPPRRDRLVHAVAEMREQIKKLALRVQTLERPRIAHVRERTALPGPNDAK